MDLRLKRVVLSPTFGRSVDWLLSRESVVQVSGLCLHELCCHLDDFSLLQRYPNIKTLRLHQPDHIHQLPDVHDDWELSVAHARHLDGLKALVHLSFSGFTALPLHEANIPHLKVSTRAWVKLAYLCETDFTVTLP